MDWDAIGAIGEIVGALAVVISLVYLGAQIRNQNRESRSAAVREILEGFRTEISAFRNSDLAELLKRGGQEFEALSDTEKIQFIAMIQGPFRLWEEAYLQYEDDRLSKQLWNGIHAQMRDFFSMKGTQKVWELRAHTYSEDFQAYVDRIEQGTYRVA